MLFHRLLSEHPQLGHVFHPFSGTNARDSPDIRRLLSSGSQDLANDTHDDVPTTANSEESLRKKVDEIERAGNIPSIKDHLFSLMRQEIMLSTIRLPLIKAISHDDFQTTSSSPSLTLSS